MYQYELCHWPNVIKHVFTSVVHPGCVITFILFFLEDNFSRRRYSTKESPTIIMLILISALDLVFNVIVFRFSAAMTLLLIAITIRSSLRGLDFETAAFQHSFCLFYCYHLLCIDLLIVTNLNLRVHQLFFAFHLLIFKKSSSLAVKEKITVLDFQ